LRSILPSNGGGGGNCAPEIVVVAAGRARGAGDLLGMRGEGCEWNHQTEG
jgi:hypothetical protein